MMRHRSRPVPAPTGTILGLTAQNRRRHYRHSLRNLAYVKLDASNGGVVRDVSEVGIATQALGTLQANQQLRLRIDLPSPQLHLEAEGRVAWIDASGEAGVELVNLSAHSRRLLKDWIFAQLLAESCRITGNAGELLFSDSSRPAIRLQAEASTQQAKVHENRFQLLWFSTSSSSFSRLVDGMVLLCAVLLFSVISLTLTDTLPSWPVAVLLTAGVAAIFSALYWFLFSAWFGTTPGRRLAELSGRASTERPPLPGRSRFR
jgi:hypothetical protein